MAAISTFFRLFLLISFVPALVPQDTTVFDVELVHRDSPKSPLYNSSMTPFDCLQAAAVRSVNRASYLDTSIDIDLGLLSHDGEFMMRFSIGTPNLQYVWGLIDTGSSLSWVDCVGCQCFNNTATLFNHSASLSYKQLSCISNECRSFSQGRCNDDQMCKYNIAYGDGSNINGIFSSETFSFTSLDTKQSTSIPNVLFGCNFWSLITKVNDPGSIIGLGPRPQSLINQLAPKYISKYFSHCLDMLDTGVNSRLFLGRSKNTVIGKTTVTPLMTQNGFYAVQLNAISIPDEFDILITRKSKLSAGNIIFDSGTYMTMLDTQVVDQLVRALTDYVSLPTVENSHYKLCFTVLSTDQEEMLPGMWFSFEGTLGNFMVSPQNLFRWNGQHVKCMMIVGTNGLQIFGNIMQRDVLVGLDLDNMELTIIEKKCTELYKS
ncbi:probable aspartic protease At2g35615 [Zingiber officinale]|uniref:probable aspartic protease At2g35615 n=1 Tax=Zingiber officinale TaxID=94328 RepID=UPI001C4B4F78|nr:probable aspartic protease At2g35615 [Zingiber officinale]